MQQLGKLEGEFCPGQLPIADDDPLQTLAVQTATDLFGESLTETLQTGPFQRQPGRHGVTTEALQQPGMAGCYPIQGVPDVQPGDGPRGTLDLGAAGRWTRSRIRPTRMPMTPRCQDSSNRHSPGGSWASS